MRKLICLTVALMLLSAAAAPASAESGDSKGLEKAVGIVKRTVSIPADFSDFQYSSYGQEVAGGDVTVWCLQWGKTDGSAYISANVNDLGNLLNYKHYVDKEEDGLAKVTREVGQKGADAFLLKAMPGLSKDMRLVNEKQDSATTWGLMYTYQLYVEDIPAPFIQAQVRINKYTGEVESFDGLDAGQKIPQFPSEKPAYSLEEAARLYSEKIPAKLGYYCYFDSQKKTLSTFAAYAMIAGGSKVIDALTGEVKDVYRGDQMEKAGAESVSNADTDGGSAGSLTPEEQAAVDKVSGLISKEKAEGILRDTVEGIDGSQKVTRSYLGRDRVESDRYYWSVSFDKASGVVDAKTGEVLSFSTYKGANGKAELTREEAEKKATVFAEKTSGTKWKKTLLSHSEGTNPPYGKEDEDVSSYRFQFERQENGIGVNGNGLYVTVDARNGKILSYNNTWYESAAFPSIEKAMGSGDAFQKFNEAGKLRLTYAMTEQDKVSLVFAFENPVTPYFIDPITGAQIGRNGKAYLSGYLPEYDDIEGHWASKTVKALLQNGYYLEGQSFKPDVKITQQDFLRFLYSPSWKESDDQDAFYKMLERNKIILPGEKSPDKLIARQEAAKYMVRYLGFDALAQKSSIFKDVFSDKVRDGYKGYAAICYGLNIMKGDINGKFNGMEGMTRAEAACALYQLLELK